VNANGGYTIPGLPPGAYRVDGGAGGARNITLAVGQVATVDLGQAAAAPADGVTTLEGVVAVAEFVPETRTSEVATYVSQKQIEALPQGTRNFLAFADTVPGMAFSQDGNGNTRLRSGAQNASAINVFIDGVGQKNYVLPGGVTGQDTSRGNPFRHGLHHDAQTSITSTLPFALSDDHVPPSSSGNVSAGSGIAVAAGVVDGRAGLAHAIPRVIRARTTTRRMPPLSSGRPAATSPRRG
jgi:hypothetical protein